VPAAETPSDVKRPLLVFLALAAFAGCSGGDGFLPSRLHSMDATQLQRLVRAEAKQTGVSAALLTAVITVESKGDPHAVSRAGAGGLMQLMPGTAATYGVVNRFDPEENIHGGARYLRDLLKRFHNDTSLALAAYNAGPGAVDAAHGSLPPIAETRAYVARVTAALRDS
jgi:soluble lytic murein transglycosylase-like protein